MPCRDCLQELGSRSDGVGGLRHLLGGLQRVGFSVLSVSMRATAHGFWARGKTTASGCRAYRVGFLGFCWYWLRWTAPQGATNGLLAAVRSRFAVPTPTILCNHRSPSFSLLRGKSNPQFDSSPHPTKGLRALKVSGCFACSSRAPLPPRRRVRPVWA